VSSDKALKGNIIETLTTIDVLHDLRVFVCVYFCQ